MLFDFQFHTRINLIFFFFLRKLHFSLAISSMAWFDHCNLQCYLIATIKLFETFLVCNEIDLLSVIHRQPKMECMSHCVITLSKFLPDALIVYDFSNIPAIIRYLATKYVLKYMYISFMECLGTVRLRDLILD